jgi:16S rRNA (guanine966-N2)-methyltransferase
MREAVFSSLGGLIEGARFADVFAGTGSYGLEALSRGAVGGTFVEQDGRVRKLLQANLAAVWRSMGGSGPVPARCLGVDALRYVPEGPLDLVFADPPYPWSRLHLPDLLAVARGWLSHGPDGRLVLEVPADLEIELSGWVQLRQLGGKGRDTPAVRILQPEAAV